MIVSDFADEERAWQDLLGYAGKLRMAYLGQELKRLHEASPQPVAWTPTASARPGYIPAEARPEQGSAGPAATGDAATT